MPDATTWLFLGLVVPQLGIHQDALPDRYFRSDRAFGQAAEDLVFVHYAELGPLGHVTIQAYVRDSRVSAVLISTEKSQEATRLLARDSRCQKGTDTGFSCQLGGPRYAVDVATCRNLLLLFDHKVAASSAHLSVCGDAVGLKSGQGGPSAGLINSPEIRSAGPDRPLARLAASVKRHWGVFAGAGVALLLLIGLFLKLVGARKSRRSVHLGDRDRSSRGL
jgi:hypothetical protein